MRFARFKQNLLNFIEPLVKEIGMKGDISRKSFPGWNRPTSTSNLIDKNKSSLTQKEWGLLDGLLNCMMRDGAFEGLLNEDCPLHFLLTSDTNILGIPGKKDYIYMGACNSGCRISKNDPENTIYLAWAFFRQPRKEQIKILHTLIVGVFHKRLGMLEAMAEAERFIDRYYR